MGKRLVPLDKGGKVFTCQIIVFVACKLGRCSAPRRVKILVEPSGRARGEDTGVGEDTARPGPSLRVHANPPSVSEEAVGRGVRAHINERVGAGDGFGVDIGEQGSDGRTGTPRVADRALPVDTEALGRGARASIDERAGTGGGSGDATGDQGSDGRTGTLRVDARTLPVKAEALGRGPRRQSSY